MEEYGPNYRYTTSLIRNVATGRKHFAIVQVDPSGENEKEMIVKSDNSAEIEVLFNKFYSL